MLCCRLNTGEPRDRAVVCGCAIRFARADRGARPPRCKNTDDKRHEDFFFWVHIARRAISPPPPRPPGAVADSLSHPEVWADIVSPAQVMCGGTHTHQCRHRRRDTRVVCRGTSSCCRGGRETLFYFALGSWCIAYPPRMKMPARTLSLGNCANTVAAAARFRFLRETT